MKTLKDMIKYGILVDTFKDCRIYEFEGHNYIFKGKNLLHVYKALPKYKGVENEEEERR